MKKTRLISAIIGFAAMGMTAAAHAAPAFSTANVNMRAGPDIDFPRVDLIPEGTRVEVRGCLSDESWCDVVWGGNRGWVISEYLAFDHRGEYVLLPDYGLQTFRIPAIRFVANDYWGRHYVSRPWYKDRNRWYSHQVRPRAGWRAPPPGKRSPGWWRAGYKPFAGMRPPPERGWKRPPNRKDDRRGDGRHDGRR